ncbi:MAG: c-type cytochrome [Steroidobacteraceae bacterium]|nr:c-type cytochrome [Steroidobacteraceae bacterium]
MKRILKWLGFVAAGLVVVVLALSAYVFIASSRELTTTHSVSGVSPLAIPSDASEIEEGRRLAALAGCMHCHGDSLGGQLVHDFPNIARFVAPNVSALQKSYSDAQLDAAIREGVKADGTGMLFMPAEMFHHMSDADAARIIAYVRTVRAAPGTEDRMEIRPLGRALIAAGEFKTGPRAIAEMAPPVNSFDAGDPVSHGKYLVMNLCTECHSQNLEGIPMAKSPPLSVAKSYSLEQFSRLMHDGVGIGDRTFELMTPTSKARFSHLREDEVAAVHAYLQSRG